MERLVKGKNPKERIVSIEVQDQTCELYVQNNDGSISSEIVPNRFFILSSENIDGEFVRLNGDLHYRWGKQYSDRREFLKWRSIWKKKDTFSVYNPTEAFMLKDGYSYYKGLEHKDVSVLSLDIETTGLDANAQDAFIVLISITYRDKKRTVKKLFCYNDYEFQGEMLDHFCEVVRELNPSILTGHNIFHFDLPYMSTIASRQGTSLKLGRDNSDITFNKYESTFRVDGNRDLTFKNISIYGRSIVDTYLLAQKWDFSKKLESYKLKLIIEQLGLQSDNRTFYDAATIRTNYKDPIEFEKIKAYCIDDSDDSLKLWDYMGAAYFYSAMNIPKSFQEVMVSATGSQINSILIRAYLQDKYSLPKATEIKHGEVEGGISFGVPGIYKNVAKVDLKSAYPSQILRFNIYDKEKDPNAYFYKMVKYFTEQRFEYKKLSRETKDQKWEDMDAASKIFINSAYGCLNTPGLLFNSPRNAAKITEETRNVIDLALTWSSGKGKDYYEHTYGKYANEEDNNTAA